MNMYEFNCANYELIKNYREAFDQLIVSEYITDYYKPFDYIVGDWSYGKLRLKGFYDSNASNVLPINDFKNIETYLKQNCAYGCRYFILKKKD